jgi:serum/glucocorticoid-regulated kinase 2
LQIKGNVKDLILKLLEKDPKKRLGRNEADDIKKHIFFRNIDWDLLKRKLYNSPMKPELNGKFDVSYFSEEFINQPAIDEPTESGSINANNNVFKGIN